MALFVTALAFALAMLSLFAVLAFANVTALSDVAPFFAVPGLLFIISGVLFLNWMEGEAQEAAAQESAHRRDDQLAAVRARLASSQGGRCGRPGAAARR